MSNADSDAFDQDAFEAKLTPALTEAVGTTEEAEAPEPEAPAEDADKVEPEAESATPEEPLLGKFKTVDELKEGYAQLEKQFHGSADQRREFNELQQQMQELTQAVQATPQAGYDWDTQIDENPKAALERAAATRNEQLYEQVKAQVNEYHPGLADVWEDNQWTKHQVAQLGQEIAARYQPVADTVERDVQVREYQDAWATTASKYPDARELIGAIQAEGESNPGLSTTDKLAYFDNLYWLVKAKQAETQQAAQQQVDAEQRQGNEAAKVAATVTSASSSGDHKPKSAVEAWKEDFRKVLFDDSTSIRAGLTTD